MDGTDFLSQKILKGRPWFKYESAAQEAFDKVTEYNEQVYANEGEDLKDYEDYAYWKTSQFSFTDKVYQTAAKKFVKYEIIELSGFECEGNTYTAKDHHFVLNDGSVFSYQSEIECD